MLQNQTIIHINRNIDSFQCMRIEIVLLISTYFRPHHYNITTITSTFWKSHCMHIMINTFHRYSTQNSVSKWTSLSICFCLPVLRIKTYSVGIFRIFFNILVLVFSPTMKLFTFFFGWWYGDFASPYQRKWVSFWFTILHSQIKVVVSNFNSNFTHLLY